MNTPKIAVIAFKDSKGVMQVDHGIDIDTLETVVLPAEEYNYFCKVNCYFDPELNAHIITRRVTQ